MPFLIFDIETRIDKELLNRAYFGSEGLAGEAAYERFRQQMLEEDGSDFAPLPLHVPISIALGEADDAHVLRSLTSLGPPGYSEENLVREFWSRVERHDGCLVTFNGRRFDWPVLELSALRYGIAVSGHFDERGSGRSRVNPERQLDLLEFLSNHGAVRMRGGIDLLLKLIGMPGKTGMDGSMVQDYYDAGRLEEIHRYCRTDVIQTYFLFLRIELMRGRIDGRTYQEACAASAPFLAELRAHSPAEGGR